MLTQSDARPNLSPMGRRREKNLDLPPRMHKKGETYYYVTTTLPRKWIGLGKDLNKARIQWAQLEGTQDDGSFSAELDAYVASRRFATLAESSQAAYKKVIPALKKFFEGAALHAIKPTHIAQWLDNHPSPAMANLGRALLSNIMESAVRQGKVDRNPCRDITGLVIKARDRYMTDEEFLSIRSKATDLVRCCMDLAYLTGLRISDILKLRLADIKEDGIYVVQQKTGNRQRYIMTPELAAAIDRAKALPRSVRGLNLLCTRRGGQYAYATVSSAFQEARDKAKVRDVRFHDIRAKAATDAKRLGQDYQAMLGHASKAMSERYVRLREYVTVEPLKKVL